MKRSRNLFSVRLGDLLQPSQIRLLLDAFAQEPVVPILCQSWGCRYSPKWCCELLMLRLEIPMCLEDRTRLTAKLSG